MNITSGKKNKLVIIKMAGMAFDLLCRESENAQKEPIKREKEMAIVTTNNVLSQYLSP